MGAEAITIKAWAAGAATAALVAGLVAAPAVAQTAGPTLGESLSGHVTSAGRAVGGASVTLIAWPDSAVLRSLRVGETVPTRTIAATTTSADGAYTLSPDLATLPSTYKLANGSVNVEQDVTTASGVTVTNFTTGAASTSTAAPSRTVNVPTPDACRPGPGCIVCRSYALAATYSNRREAFDNLYSWYGAPGTVNETSSSTHSVGVGVAVTGGKWTESGSAGLEIDSGAGAEETHTHHIQLANALIYGHYTRLCTDGYTHSYYGHEVRAVGVSALQVPDMAKIINNSLYIGYPDCTTYYSGSFTKTKGTNITFAAGVAAPFLNLSANAEYSNGTDVTFTVHQVTDVCGSVNGDGWVKSPTFGAQPPPPCMIAVAVDRVRPAC